MAIDAETVQSLIDQLAKDHQAFVERSSKTHELLQQTLVALRALSHPPRVPSPHLQIPSVLPTPPRKRRRASTNTGNDVTQASQRFTTADIDVELLPEDRSFSVFTGDSDLESNDESMFVQTALESEHFDMDGFRKHLREYKWTEGGRAILDGLVDNTTELNKECILPLTVAEEHADRSYLSHYSIYDVGFDGVPMDVKHAKDRSPTRSMEIWNRISSTNINADRRPAAGRIVIVREPSPKLFAALHYTMNKHFDVDEMFDLLRDENPGLMHPHRAFSQDKRKCRTFVITLEYFTIIGDMCKPMKWQSADDEEEQKLHHHIPISRCGSVIALSLEGQPMAHVKNLGRRSHDRKAHDKYGEVYDPFSPWRVLSIQAHPDWHATTDTHKSSNHYVNGPEAFLHTVHAEFSDARKRLKEVYSRVTECVEPPRNFIFKEKVRDALLFEDDQFTYSKRYFWAYQTLSKVNQDLTEMIESYRDTFRECVWEGTNGIIWPGESTQSSRYQHFRKRMAKLRSMMDDEIEKLEYIRSMNAKKMRDIEVLRDNLFSGTSVMESRRSIEQTLVTVEQNRSVLLLTIVTIFFLPLTFVTSVFGMSNLDPSESMGHFAWTILAVCIPTYIVIGTMHTDAGLKFWTQHKNAFFAKLGRWLASFLSLFHYHPEWTRSYHYTTRPIETPTLYGPRTRRTSSMTRVAMSMRMQQTPEDGLDSLSRTTSREKYTPRPQPTSGDARDSLDLLAPAKARTRSGSITFSSARRLRKGSVTKVEDDGDLSPRTMSPHRDEVVQRVSFAASSQGSVRGFLGRWTRKGDGHERELP